ncbi:MAG TPA: hypothetical protein VJA26_05640 [Gammaproteobacteria bacterium]|nr:hypothetical protein [Gammaproteobacteria bacterium]
MNVNEAGRDHEARRRDDLFVGSCNKLADLSDSIANDPHVCGKGLAPAAVDYAGANDNARFPASL